MALELEKSSADQKVQQLYDARDRAIQQLNSIKSSQESMLAGNWQGSSAGTYGNTSDSQNDDFTAIINRLNYVVDKGATHMQSIHGADAG